jgi:hypothetical protein
MSFIKSKHSGWTWDLKRTPFGGGGGDPISAVSDAVSQGFSDVGLGGSMQPIVTPVLDAAAIATGNPELIPLINATSTFAQTGDVGQAALSGGTAYLGGQLGSGLSSLMGDATSSMTDMIGQDAMSMQAQGLGADQIAENLQQTYGIDQYAAQNAAGIATGGGTAADIASTLGGDYGANMAGVPAQAAGTSLGDVLKTAQSGAGIIGGLAKMAGGVGALQAGQAAGQYAKQADPFAQYRSGYAAQLANLLQNPQTITTTPGYQFNLGQGLQALQAQQAAQGRLVSGGGLLQAQQFGQNYAQSNLQQQQNLLASLSGANQSPATGAAAQAGLTAGQLGGVLGGAQSIAGGLGQVLNPLQTLYANYNNPSPGMNT